MLVQGQALRGDQGQPASHFAWEEIPDQFAALITDSVTEAENRTSQ